MAPEAQGKRSAVVEHGLVFAGDLLPYGVVFLLTLIVGYGQGLGAASLFSLSYAYVAVVTAVVCGPNLLSLRRRMPGAASPGAIVAAALLLRGTIIIGGAMLVMPVLHVTQPRPGMMLLMVLLFAGRLLETSVDGPATSVQYLRSAKAYFLLRLSTFIVICGFTGAGVLTSDRGGLPWIGASYVFGSATGLLVAMVSARRLLRPVDGLKTEFRLQAGEFGRFFLATALFLAASRMHPLFIAYLSGQEAAGQFALVQNLFSALALAASGIAGVFFWSRNRRGPDADHAGVPWRWLGYALPGGLLLGLAGGAVMDFMFLRPLGSPDTLLLAAWILCAATPFLLIQSIFSNQLVLMKRDGDMLRLSMINAVSSILIVLTLVAAFGLVGAALSVGASALLSSTIGLLWLQRRHG